MFSSIWCCRCCWAVLTAVQLFILQLIVSFIRLKGRCALFRVSVCLYGRDVLEAYSLSRPMTAGPIGTGCFVAGLCLRLTSI